MIEQRILVVEDIPPLLAGIEAVLEAEGYTIFTAGNGLEALEVLESVRPDLIVADIMMPKMDGYALYEAVRNRPEWTPIPFVFLTAKATKDDILKGKALGAEDYITKPFDPRELAVTVRARLGRAQAIQAASRAQFDQLKHQIVTVLGHELRTPLTYVTGYTDMALESVPELSPEQLAQFLARIKSGADRLTHTVEDLLSLIQLDTGEAAQDFALFAVVSPRLDVSVACAVRDFEEEAAACGLVLKTELDARLPPVRLSESLFVDALGRLLDNGIKFSRGKGKHVTVSARATDTWVEVSVSDEGIGIPPQELPNLFHRFRQIDRKHLEQQGVGLGLSIARGFVRLHGGDIDVKSALGEGSTFTIRLPFAEDAAED